MRRERFDKMNVVPFIDIVLVLLVIVLATATFVTNRAIKVDLPQGSSQKAENRKSVIIAIDKTGQYFFDKKALSLDTIKLKLNGLNPEKDSVSLHTDKDTAFGYFVDIVDYMKQKGFKHISIVTKK